MKIFTTAALVSAVLLPATRAASQTLDQLSVDVQASIVFPKGGEERRVGGGADALEIGRTVHHGISQPAGACFMSVSRSVAPDSAVAWDIQITPVRLVDDAVTFRLAWARVRDAGKPSDQVKGDAEFTLRPGESAPIDVAAHSCTSPLNGASSIGTSIKVTVTRWPYATQDRRLVSLELWLVETLPSGSERTQSLSLRGLYHQPIAFYFDRITEGQTALDILGEVTIAPGEQAHHVTIVTRNRIFDPKVALGYNNYPSKTTAKVELKPNEVVSVQLPKVGCGDPLPLSQCTASNVFSSRALSLRIRVRQLR